MPEYYFPVPGSAQEKEIVVFVRRHWVAFLGQFLLAFMLLIIPIIAFILLVIFGFYPRISQGLVANFVVLFFSAYYLVAITFAFVSWISFYYNVYLITKAEIIEITQVGFFGRKISQLSLLRVQDVTSNIKGFLPTLFAFGDVLVETASEQKESFLLCSVPNPQEISSKIMELHDQVIGTEGRQEQILEGEGTLAPGKIAEKPIIKPENPPVPPPLAKEEPPTAYQELLKKDSQHGEKEGEITSDDLDKGGEVDFK